MVQVFHHVTPTWLQIGEVRYSVAYRLEIVNRQINIHRTGDSNQMKHSIC